MWNLHVMKYGYVGDCQIPVALDMFIDCRGRDLLRKNLYRNFVLHVGSMFDFGLVSPEVMQKAIRKLQNLLFENPDLQRQVATSRKEQMLYWNTVTVHKQVQPKTEKTIDRAGAGASGSTSTVSHKSGASGSGNEKKVKPTITPAKNVITRESSSSISAIDKNAISQTRRRSASAALHSNPSLANNTANKDTHHSSAHTNSSSYASPSNKRSSTTASGSNATRSHTHGNSSSNSASKLSSITTRRKSLSVGTQRKRSLN